MLLRPLLSLSFMGYKKKKLLTRFDLEIIDASDEWFRPISKCILRWNDISCIVKLKYRTLVTLVSKRTFISADTDQFKAVALIGGSLKNMLVVISLNWPSYFPFQHISIAAQVKQNKQIKYNLSVKESIKLHINMSNMPGFFTLPPLPRPCT